MRIVISLLDPDETEQADLRGGRSPWFATGPHAVGLEVIENLKCDALVVGGGITGSLVAERLTRQGLGVVLIDRELPGSGSTAASTSMLLDVFGIGRAGAIVSPGAADADPLQLARGLLGIATARGTRLFEAEAVEFDPSARSVGVQLKNGRQIEARSVVLATGYVMPAIVQSTIHTVASSWAIATTPQPQNIWKEGVLIWEDSKNYLYARTTRAGRIIVGGEDSDQVIEPDARDGLIPEKADILVRRLAALWPAASLDIEFRWSGAFDNTSDGLPLIGPVPGAKGLYAAYGYGGNGITFSFLAARLIGELIAGASSELAADFALDRDGRSIGR